MKNNKLQNNTVIYFFIISCLFFTSKISHAQNWVQMQDQIKDNTQQVKNLEDKIVNLGDNYKLLYDGTKNQNDQLGNQISFAGYLLGGFSFIFTILGIFLAWYINRQYEKVKEMKENVESIKEYIDENSKELYKKIKRDETMELLNRLKEVPEDIANICPLLLSRDLFEEDYLCLKESYLKLNNDLFNKNKLDQYVILLTQHFPYQSLKDEDLKTEIITYINTPLLNNMFKRDIKNLFDNILKYIKEFGINDESNRIIIKNLFYSYFKSKFKENVELKNFIKELFEKNKYNKLNILNVAKEHDPDDILYINWLDLILQ